MLNSDIYWINEMNKKGTFFLFSKFILFQIPFGISLCHYKFTQSSFMDI